MAQAGVKVPRHTVPSIPGAQPAILGFIRADILNLVKVTREFTKILDDPEIILYKTAAATFKQMGDMLVNATPKDLGHGAANWHASNDDKPTRPLIVPPRGGPDSQGHLTPVNPRKGLEATLGNITFSPSKTVANWINQAEWVAIADEGLFKTGVMKTYGPKRFWAAKKKIEEREARGIPHPSSSGGYSSQAPGPGIMDPVLEEVDIFALIELDVQIVQKGWT